MGLFTPGWLKSSAKANDMIKKTFSLKVLGRIATEGSYEDPAKTAQVMFKAVKEIGGIEEDKEKKTAVLTDIIQNGANPFVRCAAGHVLGGSDGKRAVRENIADAYAYPGDHFVSGSEEWLKDLKTNDQARKAFYACSGDSAKAALAGSITDPSLLMDIALQEEKNVAETAFKQLKPGHDQWVRLAEGCRTAKIRREAIDHLTKDDEKLLTDLAGKGSDDARRRLIELDYKTYALKYPGAVPNDVISGMGSEDTDILESLADSGSDYAASCLVKLDVRSYGDKYRKHVTKEQIDSLGADDLELLKSLAEDGNTSDAAQRRLVHIKPGVYGRKYKKFLDEEAINGLQKEDGDLLLQLADEGNDVAKYRLLEVDIVKYRDKYLSIYMHAPELKVLAIKAGMHTDEELCEMIRTAVTLDRSVEAGLYAWAAMESIKDRKLLIRFWDKIDKRRNRNASLIERNEDWMNAIVERMKDDEDLLAELLILNKHLKSCSPMELAVSYIRSDSALLRVALTSSPAALMAARRLGSRYLDQLKESRNYDVRKYASVKWCEENIDGASESTAMKIIEILSENSAAPEIFKKAYKCLRSDDLRLRAYDLLSRYMSRDFEDLEQTWKMILDDVSDPELFIDFCMRPYPDHLMVDRLRSLIDGTSYVSTLINKAVKKLMKDPLEGWAGMRLLSKYYHESEYACAWKYAREPYIEKLLDEMKRSKEITYVRKASDIMRQIYKEAPASRDTLGKYNGRTFTGHYDYRDPQCLGNNRSYQESYKLEF